MLSCGLSCWARSQRVTRSKARLGGAKNGNPVSLLIWWHAVVVVVKRISSRWVLYRFRDPPRPVSLRMVHCTLNSMSYRRTLWRTVVYFYFWLICDFLLYGSYIHNLVDCLITPIITEKKKRKKKEEEEEENDFEELYCYAPVLRQNHFQLVPAWLLWIESQPH